MTTTIQTAQSLHHDYVEAINSNDTDRILHLLDEEAIFQVPGEPQMQGKEAISEFSSSLFEAFDAKWVKTTTLLAQADTLATSTYTYVGTYRDKQTGETMTEHGKGTCVYRRGNDGQWRLVVDSWSTNEGAEG